MCRLRNRIASGIWRTGIVKTIFDCQKVTDAVMAALPPIREDTLPHRTPGIILYFADEAARDEYIEAVKSCTRVRAKEK